MAKSLRTNKRVAVVTASNLGYTNTGMVTVDLALNSLLKRISGEVTVSWYTLHVPSATPLRKYLREEDLPFQFQPLEEQLDHLYEHDAVVFWGDFLQARHYMAQDATYCLLKFGYVPDRSSAMNLLYRALLLRDAPDELLPRTVLYGGTILHNSQHDYTDGSYASAFTRLLTQCRAVWMREPLSAAKVAQLRHNDGNAHFGADAALLLPPEDLDGFSLTGWADLIPAQEVVGIFLGHRTEVPSWLPEFCHQLSARFDAKLEWLPWFDTPPLHATSIAARRDGHTFGDLLQALSRYKFVISDTYHLCLNAWRVGTPAICIGSPQPGGMLNEVLSLNDLKKHIFHLTYDAKEFYISTGAEQQRKEQLERLAEMLNGAFVPIIRRIQDHAQQSASAFQQELESILE